MLASCYLLWYNWFIFFFSSDLICYDTLMGFYQLILRPEFAFCTFSFIFSLILSIFNTRAPLYIILYISSIVLYILQSYGDHVCTKHSVHTSINLLLLNGWLQFHPWILYVGLGLIVYRFAYLPYFIFSIFGLSRFFFTTLSKTAFIYDYLTFVICLLALLSGSLWASQDFNWLGLWNWDNIELILLFFILLYVGFVHYSTFTVVLFPVLLIIGLVIFFFFFFSPGFVELHFSQHNFFDTTTNFSQTIRQELFNTTNLDTLLPVNSIHILEITWWNLFTFDHLLPVWSSKLNFSFNWAWFCSVILFLIYYCLSGLSLFSRHTLLNSHTLMLFWIFWTFFFFFWAKV